jgi:hypothetical protein
LKKTIHKTLILSLLIIIIGMPISSYSQHKLAYYVDTLTASDLSNNNYKAAFMGGLNTPQYSKCDVNGDSLKDFVVFDRQAGKFFILINENNGKDGYTYAPEYEKYFPELTSWVLMVDYNRDGKEDIFSANRSNDLLIYKNITGDNDTVPSFKALSKHTYRNNYFSYDTVEIRNPLTARSSDLPAIADVDGDGDIDILTYNPGLGTMSYYQNREVEDNFNIPDSFSFEFVDLCWGYFSESTTSNDVLLHQCDTNQGFQKKYRHFLGSGYLLYDMDNDGDMDLLLSNDGFDDVILLTNGKVETGHAIDTMIAITKDYPSPKEISITKFPHCFMQDVDNDSILDLITAPGSSINYKDRNQVLFYKNKGSNEVPDFDYVQSNYMVEHMIDLGSYACPTFWDYDGDGDQDLFVSATGDYTKTEHLRDRIYYFKNNGGKFQLMDTNFGNLSNYNLDGLTITFGDLDGDNLEDLMVGSTDGKIGWYENTGSVGAATFVQRDTEINNISQVAYAKPFLYDMDNDNKLDIVVGNYNGYLKYYRNTSGSNNLEFTLVADTFGRIRTNGYLIGTNPPVLSDEGFAAPYVVDVTGDGNPEIVIGNTEGEIEIYEVNMSAPLSEFKKFNSPLKTIGLLDTAGYKNVPKFSQPALALVDGDTILDMIVGTGNGGMMYFRGDTGNIDHTIGIYEPPFVNRLYLYPNPASNKLNISRINYSGDYKVQIFDLLGKSVFTKNIEGLHENHSLDISSINNGTYIVVGTDANGNPILQSKIIVLKNGE